MAAESFPFDSPLVMYGPFRAPKQMLEKQNYDGNQSIHDDAVAERLGFKGAPIEGPTHFSQFEPLLVSLWGQRFYEQGCISAHYKNMVVEGEEVRASIRLPPRPLSMTGQVRIHAEKRDGTPVLDGTASIGPDHPETELERRMKTLEKPGKFVILRDLKVGDRGAGVETVSMDFDQQMGEMYPFSLGEKLEKITEVCSWQGRVTGKDSPWGRPIVPFEMISVLTEYTKDVLQWKIRSPRVGLFADLEIRMLDGPVFVGERYVREREVVALSESRRTESFWVRTILRHEKSGRPVVSALLNHAVVKDSFPGYEEERNR